MIELDDLDRSIIDRLHRMGRVPLTLLELVNENRDHDADADEIRRRLVRLEMAGMVHSDPYYRAAENVEGPGHVPGTVRPAPLHCHRPLEPEGKRRAA